MIITKETWGSLPGTDREWVLYNTLQDIDDRLKRLETKSIFHKSLAFLGGILGGIAAYFGSKMFH